MAVEIKKLDGSLVEIKGEIPHEELILAKEAALKHLGEHLNIDGFRPGHIPANVVEKNAGEMAVLEEMARITLSKNYPKIVKENNIDAIGYPQINITKLAAGNPLGYTIIVATVPEIKLPDYKKLAKSAMAEAEDIEISDSEFEKALEQIKIMRQKEDAKGAEIPEGAPLPDLDDEFVKKLGDFKDLPDFKEKVRANMSADKKWRVAEKKRVAMMEKIISETKIDVPDILIEAEAHKLVQKMKTDIENMGLKYDDYMKTVKKTEEDLRKEMKSDAEKRAKMQLIIGEIAKLEKIEAPKDKVTEEVKKVTEIYKDADPENARMYIESVLQNEEVMKFLESQK